MAMTQEQAAALYSSKPVASAGPRAERKAQEAAKRASKSADPRGTRGARHSG